jgi:quercetin dioxygenase-like cupin family protein
VQAGGRVLEASFGRVCFKRQLSLSGRAKGLSVVGFYQESAMTRIAFVLVGAFGISVLASSHPAGSGERVKVIATYDLKEKLDGKDAGVTTVEVTIGPGQAGFSHRHPGSAFVYVIEGTYELGIDDKPTKIYKAGETFQEPSGCLHRVSRNPASSGNTRLVAMVLHPRGVKDIVTPAQQH